MARIENSLSMTPRKKKISSSNSSITSALVTTNANLSSLVNVEENLNHITNESKSNSLKSVSAYSRLSQNGTVTPIYKTSRDIAREMDALKNALKDKENVIDR